MLIKNDTINTHSKICTYVYIMNETSSHSLYDFKLFFSNKVYVFLILHKFFKILNIYNIYI